MISVDVLAERFGAAVNVAPWGDCLVVPGAVFESGWEAELGDQGFRCHFGELDRHAAVFVQLKNSVAAGKVVYVPQRSSETQVQEVHSNVEASKLEDEKQFDKKKGVGFRGANWQSVEDDLLVSLWNSTPQLTIREILKQFNKTFPLRSESAVANRISALQHLPDAKIKPRFQVKNRKIEEKNKSILEHFEKVEKIMKSEEDPEDNSKIIEQIVDDIEKYVDNRLKDVEVKLGVLGEISEAYVQLKKRFDEVDEDLKAAADMLSGTQKFSAQTNDKLVVLQKNLALHKHAKFGNAVVPLEVPE